MPITYINKGRTGWTAETIIDLEDNKRLTITTMKRHNNRLMTTASVGRVEGMFVSHTMYQDFSKVISASDPKKVTEKSVSTQHSRVMEPQSLQSIMTMVKTHYAPV